METKKSWEDIQCKKGAFSAYRSNDHTCWIIPGTYCKNNIHGKLMDKIEMCVDCILFQNNIDSNSLKETLLFIKKQINEYQQKAEQSLKEKEERYRLLFDNVSDAVFVHEASPETYTPGRFIEVNNVACQYLGYTREELLQMSVPEIDALETLPNVLNMLKRLFSEGHAMWESVHISKDGRRIPVEISNRLFELHDKPLILSTVRDITERKRTEKEISSYQKQIEALINSSSDFILLKDKEFRNRIINKACGSFFSINIEDIIGKTDFDFMPKEFAEGCRRSDEEALRSKDPVIKEEFGRGRWFHIVKQRITEGNGDVIGVAAVIRDITERKLAEDVVKRSEEKFRMLFNSASDAIAIHDLNGHFLEVNEALCERLGYSHNELLHMRPTDIDAPENAALVQKRIGELQQRGTILFETVYTHRDGMPIPVEVSSRIINYDGTSAILSIARDISNRKIVEQMIENLRRQNELILNSAWEGVLGLDIQGRHTFINPSAARMLGYAVEELIGKSSHPIWHHTKEDGSVYPEAECPIHKTIRCGGEHYMEEDIFWRKDGTSFPVSYASTPIIENGIIVGAVVTFQNITDRKQVQEKIKSSLREKELLLKEIHHRVKNNMQILNSLISFQIKENNDSRINQILAECKNRIRTMSIIHEKLYQAKYFSSIDIRNLLSDIAGALVYSLRDMGKQIDLIVNIPDIAVGIDTAIPLGLIVNEIVSNSLKHAFPSDMNGEISINLHAVNEGFELSIRDTGVGFPDAFDMEKTDSLGMFLIYTLVEQLGGNIKIVSDNGTTIKINFNRH